MAKNKRLFNFFSKVILLLMLINIFPQFNSIKYCDVKAYEVEGKKDIEDLSLSQTKFFVENYFLYPVKREILNLSSPKEMIKALNEPYSTYFTKEEYEDFLNVVNMKIYGIGIYIEMKPEGVLIKSVIKGSPSEEVGMKNGDIILEAAGVSLKGKSAEEALKLIKGSLGTKVELKVKRDKEQLNFKVERREIKIPTAEGKVLPNNIGYIAIHSFGEDTEQCFKEAIEELKIKKVQAYIIDLRDDGGGYLDTAVDIAGHFISGNSLMKIKNKEGIERKLSAAKSDLIIDKPTITLTNENTASASEILSAALKDYDKAYFLGNKTYGKGVAQSIFKLVDGSAMKITTEEFFSPMGNKINTMGIIPNIYLKDVDSLKVAEMLLQNPSYKETTVKGNKINTGFIKIVDGNWSFQISLKDVIKNVNYKEFKALMENLSPNTVVYEGTNTQWIKVDKTSYLGEEKLFNNLLKDYKRVTPEYDLIH